jgi:O-antigen/teichoic acid export membrane protein
MNAIKDHSFRAIWDRGRHSAVLVGLIGTGFRVGANLLLVPILLLKLSEKDLALWWAFLALGAFAFLADFGFGQAILRVYSYLWAGAEDFETEGVPASDKHRPPNFVRLAQLNATVRYLYRQLSLIGLSCLAIGGTLFLRKSVGQSGHPMEIWLCWAGFVVIIGYNLMTSQWGLACQGVNRMREVQMAALVSSIGYVVTAAALLLAGAGLVSVVAATFVRAAILHFYCRRIYNRAVPAVHSSVSADVAMLKRLWPNAWKFGILSVGAYCVSNSQVLVSTRLLGSATTASVGLTVTVGGFAGSLAMLWLAVKWPQITILRTQGRLEEMALLFARRLGLVMGSFVALAAVILFLGNALLAWKGTHARLLPTPYLALYLLYLAQQILYGQFGALAHTENVVPFFRIALCTGVTVLLASFVLTRFFGLWGLFVAPLVTELSYSSWFTVRRGFQGQPLSVRQFCRAALFGQ